MHVSYNGVTLELLTLDRVSRRAVLTPDQTEVLYTEWEISVSCVYHPALIAPWGGSVGGTSVGFQSPSQRDGTPQPQILLGSDPVPSDIFQPGDEGPIRTDRELMLRLSIPRKPLMIWAYEADETGDFIRPIIWLESPRRKNPFDPSLVPVEGWYPRDAANGPIVQATVVTAAMGEAQTFAVQLEIRTWVTPCPHGSDRYVLAHRWQMDHHHDENYYLTRTTTGEVWFNGALKDTYEQRPDLISKQLFHPIPLGFRRFLGPITRSPDGLVVRYSYSDVDQKVVFDPGNSGATHISINENLSYHSPIAGVWGEGSGAVTGFLEDMAMVMAPVPYAIWKGQQALNPRKR